MKDNAPATDPRPAHTSPRRRSLSIRGRLTIAFVLIPGVFIALRFGLRFGAPFYEVLILSLVFVLLAALLVERNKREFG